VRRTDKINKEASFHRLSEYMTYVEEYYDMLESTHTNQSIERNVYLASDDVSVFNESRQK
jgi:glycoprotein 6-alpha-L-fucosyltransferase